LAFARSLSPEGRQRAMRRPGHRIFVDARPGREESRHEIELTIGRWACYDHSPRAERPESREIGTDRAQLLFAGNEHQVVEPSAPDVAEGYPQRIREHSIRFDRLRRRGGESTT